MRGRPRGGRRWGLVKDAWSTQLWPVPATAVVLALVVGEALPHLDAHVVTHLSPSVTQYLFGGDPAAARDLLEAIAGSLITVTSLTFSLTVVTLQLASSQFSPRLLRTFGRDRFVHDTLALLLATFVYSLTVLRTVRTDEGSTHPAFVPDLSVTFGFVLTFASALSLVAFLAHLARSIRVETMLGNVHDEAAATTRRSLPERTAPGGEAMPAPPSGATPLCAAASGFVVSIDEDLLLHAAVQADAVVAIDTAPGASVIAGTPVGSVWAAGAAPLAEEGLERVRAALGRAMATGPERTAAEDVGFGFRQLTDVALKALSPGINDPTTAIHALSHSAALLCDLTERDCGSLVVRDDEGRVRVAVHRPGFAELLDLAVAQPRRYGASDPLVLGRLAQLLWEVGWRASAPGDLDALGRQVDRLEATIDEQGWDEPERAGLDRGLERARGVLDRPRSGAPT